MSAVGSGGAGVVGTLHTVSKVVFGLISLGLTAVLPTGAPAGTTKLLTAMIFFPGTF